MYIRVATKLQCRWTMMSFGRCRDFDVWRGAVNRRSASGLCTWLRIDEWLGPTKHSDDSRWKQTSKLIIWAARWKTWLNKTRRQQDSRRQGDAWMKDLSKSGGKRHRHLIVQSPCSYGDSVTPRAAKQEKQDRYSSKHAAAHSKESRNDNRGYN